MRLFIFALLTATSLVQGALFGGDNSCELLTPTNPDCCFMTDKDHKKSQALLGSLPLYKSPFIVNLVTANQKTLNKLEAREFQGNVIQKLTPLIDDSQNPGNQIPGGPVRIELTSNAGTCFDHFWVQGQKYLPDKAEGELSGSFKEELHVAEYPYTMIESNSGKIKNTVGCDKRLFGGKKEATVVSPTNKCQNSVILSWTPPPKCTQDQLNSGASHLCRRNEDIYFFLFTIGNTKGGNKFYIGQNTFGFYVSELVD